MTTHSKLISASNVGSYLCKLGLVAALGIAAVGNAQSQEQDHRTIQLAMIEQPSERARANEELNALEEEYINATIQALTKKDSGPNFSDEEVYVDHLVDVMEGKTQKDQPNYADEEVYVDHLVEILYGK